MAASARNPREARETPDRNTSGTAANIYKEMQDATKGSDEMTWEGKECLLIGKESIGRWMKQLAKLCDASGRVATTTIDTARSSSKLPLLPPQMRSSSRV